MAENETYECQLNNRLLKYFKPVYLDEVDLKEIAEIYKQRTIDKELYRECIDACISMHNFVSNIQSNG